MPAVSKTRIVLPIEGMTCASCAATVQEALAGATGVSSAGVNFATNKAAIEYDAAQTNVGQLITTVREAGYNCGKATVSFGIVDLHYAPSVAPLERSLSSVNGVIRAVANQATETATVDYIPGVVSAEDLEHAVDAAGFVVAAPIAAAGFKEGPYPNVTGGFGEQSCHLCHLDNPVNAPGGRVTLDGVPATFRPGGSRPPGTSPTARTRRSRDPWSRSSRCGRADRAPALRRRGP